MATRHLFVFDSRVQDPASFLSTLPEDSAVLVLDGTQDGLAQILAALEGMDGLDSIHLVSHGSSGALRLGDSLLTLSNLAGHAEALALLGGHLSADGDLLLYGCDVAFGEQGRLLHVDEEVALAA